MGLDGALERHTDTTVTDLREQTTPEPRWVGGVITGLTRKYTKRGELMATFTLEDLQSTIEVWVFPRTMLDVAHLLADDVVVCVKGRLDNREDQPKLICMDLKRPELTADGAQPLHLDIPVHALTDSRVDRLKQLLVDHPGPSPVFLHVGSKCIRLDGRFRVDTSNGLVAELRVLLGAGCLWN
jgi:DNA polymerase-3 subunit alpha